MAVIRNTASAVRRGRVGNTSYYYSNGQQVARQARNNSNYGETARRSMAQQERRVCWANLVNLYKVMAPWQKKAYETKKSNQTDYNVFMSLNVPSAQIYLTKDEANNGCAVVDAYTISQGSLPPITYKEGEASRLSYTDIVCTLDSLAGVTLGAFSANIIANNPLYRNGDNIAFLLFSNWADGTTHPYADCAYYEITLDTSSTASLGSNPISQFLDIQTTTNFLGVGEAWWAEVRGVAWAAIHTRQGNTLQVSSQKIEMLKPIFVDNFSTNAQQQLAVNSYGVDEDVPLDPSFSSARVRSAYVNGVLATAALISFPSYTGNVTLEISVDGWNDETCYLMFGDVRYTPLATDGNKRTYIIGDNGSVRIYINGGLYGGFEVQGIVLPSILPTRITCYLSDIQGTGGGNFIDTLSIEGNCLNYPYFPTTEYPYFRFVVAGSFVADDWQDFQLYNCVANAHDVLASGSMAFNLSPVDVANVAYVTYQGFIVAVFNYTN